MLDSVKVGVSMSDAVVDNDKGRNGSNETDLTEEVLVNTGTEDGDEIVEEPILRSVLLPIVMSVHRPAILALLLAIGKVGNILNVTEGVEAWIGLGRGG